mgnify:FL=1
MTVMKVAKYKCNKGPHWLQRALLGEESEEGGKWQPILGKMNPVKVQVGSKGPYWLRNQKK